MSWDISNESEWKYNEIPLGCQTLESATSYQYFTGGWRTNRPIWDPEACKHCLICWINCPDTCITVADTKMNGIDLDHCKGCGVCVNVCPFNALSLMNEEDAKGAQACQL